MDDVATLLDDLARGDRDAAERLMPLVYDELRALAEHIFRGQRPAHTLQPTALVHEAYVKLVEGSGRYESRSHFLGVAARAMRHILIDHARKTKAARHGGGINRITLDEALLAEEEREVDLLALDDAMRKLADLDARKCQVVEMRFFGGLGIEETAEALGIARSTVTEDWRLARAWLVRELGREADTEEP